MKTRSILSTRAEDYSECLSLEQMYSLPERILALKVPESVSKRELVGKVPLNSKQIQICAEEAWRTRCDNFANIQYVFATLPLNSRERAIIGVFQFGDLREEKTGKRLDRVRFQGMRPAPDAIVDKYLGKKITGFNPRDTNPIRYFGAASLKNKTRQ